MYKVTLMDDLLICISSQCHIGTFIMNGVQNHTLLGYYKKHAQMLFAVALDRVSIQGESKNMSTENEDIMTNYFIFMIRQKWFIDLCIICSSHVEFHMFGVQTHEDMATQRLRFVLCLHDSVDIPTSHRSTSLKSFFPCISHYIPTVCIFTNGMLMHTH